MKSGWSFLLTFFPQYIRSFPYIEYIGPQFNPLFGLYMRLLFLFSLFWNYSL